MDTAPLQPASRHPASSPSASPAASSQSGGIVTPEAVVLDLETAGFASRMLAGLIDLLAMVGLLIVASILVGLAVATSGVSESTATTIMAVLVFMLLFGYPIVLETAMRGRTPGKAALRLRAVTVDGAPIQLREAVLRAMGGIVDRMLPPGGITGVLFVLGTPRRQRVGDLVAGTIVIRDPERYRPPPALWFPVPYGLEAYAETIDPTPITVEQYTVIRSFLTRVNSLAPNARHALATELADGVSRVMHRPRDPAVTAEAYLLCVMARYQRRNGPATPLPVA